MEFGDSGLQIRDKCNYLAQKIENCPRRQANFSTKDAQIRIFADMDGQMDDFKVAGDIEWAVGKLEVRCRAAGMQLLLSHSKIAIRFSRYALKIQN